MKGIILFGGPANEKQMQVEDTRRVVRVDERPELPPLSAGPMAIPENLSYKVHDYIVSEHHQNVYVWAEHREKPDKRQIEDWLLAL